ncbi:RD21A [Symbiodinium pilosum]|uniref:RD21A protein n=1 Tax=Symbiodinium pilosum TaxID=2952 RepID=A0A812V655_SYMPI|nr:RD21A [Symbiodinium pilosum]
MAEAESFRLLQARFSTSGLATTYEIVQVPGASRVDAIFRPKSSSVGGLCLQLKAANSSGNRGMSYAFRHTQGYAGMLLLLVPLDLDILWAVPGSRITQTGVQVTLGSKRDRSWRVLELGRTLEWFFHQPATFPHVTFSDAALQSCEAHLLEAKAHNLMAKALSSVNCHLIRSGIASAPVDSRIRTGIHTWDVQEKATRLHKSRSVGRYMANLFRHGGALGRLAYDEHDFDVLLVAILEGEALLGMFMFPVHVLAARGLVGHKPMQLALYPPWKLPAKKGCRLKQAWQLDYFIGLQDWDGDSSLCKQAQSRLLELVQKLPLRKNTFCRSDSRMDGDGKQDLADLSEEEFSSRSSTKLGRPEARTTLQLEAEADKPNPTAMDWRSKGVVTAVKDQGGCGSCWAFSATETVESHYAIQSGKLLTLAPQTYVDCVENPQECGGTGGCEGATMELAFNLTITKGIALETSMPYKGRDASCPTYTPAVKASAYVRLPVNDASALETALATKGPVSVTVAAGSWQLYGGGIFSGCSQGSDNTLDHGVQAVGYAKDYWLVRNSWGPSWGEKGYIRLSRASDDKTFIDHRPADGEACKPYPKTQTIGGECGVLFDSSYPTGLSAGAEEIMV